MSKKLELCYQFKTLMLITMVINKIDSEYKIMKECLTVLLIAISVAWPLFRLKV